MDVGQAFQKQSRRTQVVTTNGDVASSGVYGYANLTTYASYVNCSNIYQQTLGCTRWENGVSVSSGTYTVDAQTLAAVPSDIRLWTNPNTTSRGLVTSRNDGYTNRTATYNLAGQPVSGGDGQGLTQAITY